MAGTVYFIRSPLTGTIKIGFTADDPGLRLRRLRATCPCPLEPIALMDGDKATEREVHTRFAGSWSHGEWFATTPELEAFIVENGRAWVGRPLAFRRKLPTIPIEEMIARVVPAEPVLLGPLPPERIPGDPRLRQWAKRFTFRFGYARKTVIDWSGLLGYSIEDLWRAYKGPFSVEETDRLIAASGDWLARNPEPRPSTSLQESCL